jgi:chromosomal replication initiator protein
VARSVCRGRALPGGNPLFLHGPSGTGKTHLITVLVSRVTDKAPEVGVAILAARELSPTGADAEEDAAGPDPIRTAKTVGLLVVEDVQHLPEAGVGILARLVDQARTRRQQLIITATAGPARLERLPVRLASRLAAGLVVGMEALTPAGRLTFLRHKARERGLKLDAAVLSWLAERLPGSGRVLEGALARIEDLCRLQPTLTPAVLEEHFATEAAAHRPTVERIVGQVGRYFRVDAGELRGPGRHRGILLPRQVGMYLARRLTDLSLEQIGAYFGGRDHSTVLHACRKVEESLAEDARLQGAVRQLHAELG